MYRHCLRADEIARSWKVHSLWLYMMFIHTRSVVQNQNKKNKG